MIYILMRIPKNQGQKFAFRFP